MDELEISGKRYISTRRAAKEHKYSSDYIGQLIRGKKVVGHKVGRSWYVEETSLKDYLGKEGKEKGSEKKKEAFAAVKPLDETSSPKTFAEEDVIVEEKTSVSRASLLNESVRAEKEIKTSSRIKHLHLGSVRREETEEERAYRIPVQVKEKKGLVYLKDDEPFFPAVEKKKGRAYVQNDISVPPPPPQAPNMEEETIFVEAERAEAVPQKKSSFVVRATVLLLVGFFVTGTVLGVSTTVGSKLVKEEGKGVEIQFSRY